MGKHVRHLRGLQAFDLAATHGNLSRAAEQLAVTHGAVSRQIKLLEEYLGVALLRRLPNGVEKTEAGDRLHQATRRAFTELGEGVRDVAVQRERNSLTVSLSASLATKWLVPNLPSFRKQNAGVSIFLDTNDALVDLQGSEIDIALRYGVPGWGDLDHDLISAEELIVVASPKLVSNRSFPMTPEDVMELPLLHDAFNPAWDKWMDANGQDKAAVAGDAITFADSGVLIAAAIDGQGVALARHLLVQDDLKAGRLVRLDRTVTPLERALYFVCRRGDGDRAVVKRFRRWLRSVSIVNGRSDGWRGQ